jgi:hypothetical protein
LALAGLLRLLLLFQVARVAALLQPLAVCLLPADFSRGQA